MKALAKNSHCLLFKVLSTELILLDNAYLYISLSFVKKEHTWLKITREFTLVVTIPDLKLIEELKLFNSLIMF